MSTRKKGKVGKALRKKGFVRDSTRDHVYYFFHHEGQKTAVYTKLSHGKAADDLSEDLISKMARQCRLSKDDFLDLVDCPLTRSGYSKKLEGLGIISAA